MQPKVEMQDGENWKKGDDVVVEMSYEALPEIPEVDLSKLKLEKIVVKAEDKAVDEALENLAKSAKNFEDRKKGSKAKDGDQVVIDFVGKIDGEAFEGGAGEDYPLELGSGSFIPGFEEQLVGAKVGDEVAVNVTFPAEYGAKHLAGKEAVFDCTVKAVKEPKPAEIDDELAKQFGAESLEALKGQITERLEAEYSRRRASGDEAGASRPARQAGEVRPAAEPRRGRGEPDRPPALARREPRPSRPRPPRDRRRRMSTRRWPSAGCGLAFSSPRSAARRRSR